MGDEDKKTVPATADACPFCHGSGAVDTGECDVLIFCSCPAGVALRDRREPTPSGGNSSES